MSCRARASTFGRPRAPPTLLLSSGGLPAPIRDLIQTISNFYVVGCPSTLEKENIFIKDAAGYEKTESFNVTSCCTNLMRCRHFDVGNPTLQFLGDGISLRVERLSRRENLQEATTSKWQISSWKDSYGLTCSCLSCDK